MICFKSCRSRVNKRSLKGMFESVVVVAFQSVFYAEMHQNDIFFSFFKKLFLRSAHQNDIKNTKKINF
jgi:hypothetical protein